MQQNHIHRLCERFLICNRLPYDRVLRRGTEVLNDRMKETAHREGDCAKWDAGPFLASYRNKLVGLKNSLRTEDLNAHLTGPGCVAV